MADPIPWTFVAGGEPFEQLDSQTDVLTANKTGTEQRRQIRFSPRVWLGFDGLDSADDRRWLEQLLAVNGGKRWLVPFVPDGDVLSAALPSGSSVIPLDTRWTHYAADGYVLLLGPTPRQYEVVQVDTLSDTQLNLVDATVQSWPAGTQVFPLLPGRLDPVPTLSRFTSDAVPHAVKFRLDPPVDWPADAGVAVYRGLPVLEWDPDWSNDPQYTPERSLDTVDFGVAAPAVHDLVGLPLPLLARSVAATGRQQVGALRGLLYALSGRWKPVWVPSLAQDFRMVAMVANGATTLDVAWCGYSGAAPVENRRDIRIALFNGTVLYRRIASAAAISSSVERLTLDNAIATGFAVGDVAQMSFMPLCRQESDTAVLRHWKNGVARCDLQFRAVPHGL